MSLLGDRCTLEFYNISVVDAPLVRDYYWNYLNIPELNTRLLEAAYNEKYVSITSPVIKIPPMPAFSHPIKLVFHIYNHSAIENIKFNIKRRKHCACECIETPVTINKFKMLFHCAHRSMLKLNESQKFIEPQGYGYITLEISYDVPGVHIFEFNWEVLEKRKITLIFEMDVLQFDPLKCIITRALLPVKIDDYYSYQQPLWLFNQYGTDLVLKFSTEEKSLKITNPIVNLKRHSIKPLLVKFRPDMEGWCTLNLSMVYKNIRTDLKIAAKGVKQNINPVQYSPLNDIPCPVCPYALFQNSLSICVNISEITTKVIAVSNYSDKCVECKWKNYILPEYFHIKCIPENFLCKPGQPVLCMVKVIAYKQRSRFHKIPLKLEIHRYVIPPLNPDYEHLHAEKESIDDSKIFEPTLITKIFLNINLIIETNAILDFSQEHEIFSDKRLPTTFDRNILDEFFWKTFFTNDFLSLLINNSKAKNCTYEELIKGEMEIKDFSIKKEAMKEIFRQFLFKSAARISKNWQKFPNRIQ